MGVVVSSGATKCESPPSYLLCPSERVRADSLCSLHASIQNHAISTYRYVWLIRRNLRAHTNARALTHTHFSFRTCSLPLSALGGIGDMLPLQAWPGSWSSFITSTLILLHYTAEQAWLRGCAADSKGSLSIIQNKRAIYDSTGCTRRCCGVETAQRSSPRSHIMFSFLLHYFLNGTTSARRSARTLFRRTTRLREDAGRTAAAEWQLNIPVDLPPFFFPCFFVNMS